MTKQPTMEELQAKMMEIQMKYAANPTSENMLKLQEESLMRNWFQYAAETMSAVMNLPQNGILNHVTLPKKW